MRITAHYKIFRVVQKPQNLKHLDPTNIPPIINKVKVIPKLLKFAYPTTFDKFSSVLFQLFLPALLKQQMNYH